MGYISNIHKLKSDQYISFMCNKKLQGIAVSTIGMLLEIPNSDQNGSTL